MKSAIKIMVATSALALAACDSDNSRITDGFDATQTFDIQVLHGSADAPPVNVLVDGAAVLENVDYKVGSGQLELDAGSYTIEVEAILPGGNASVIGPVTLDFAADTVYTIAAVGSVASIDPDTALQPVVFSQARENPASGSARLAVLHGAPDAPEVDVYVTAPGADLAGSAPVGTFAFGGTIGPAEVAAGDYQIRVTPAGAPGTVVFDSGTVSLASGDDFFVTAVPSTSAGSSPISLSLLTGSGSAEILSVDTPASLRVFHKSPDTPAVDIVVNDNFESPLVPSLTFPNFAGYVSVPADTYNVKVTPAGDPGVIPIEADLTLEAAQAYDVFAVDFFGSPVTALVLNDDPRTVATYAKVRIVHASPTAQDVDIYVTAPGTDIETVDPTLASVPFQANTGYIPLPEGSYDVTVVPAGTKDAAIGPATFAFANGDVLTVVARDAEGGGPPLNVVVAPDIIAFDD